MKRKTVILIILLLMVITGIILNKNKETLEDMYVVSCIICSKDTVNDEIRVTLLRKNTKYGDNQPSSYIQIKGKGRKISLAIEDAKRKSGKVLSFAHTKCVLIEKSFRNDANMMHALCAYILRNTDFGYSIKLYTLEDRNNILSSQIDKENPRIYLFLDNLLWKNPSEDAFKQPIYTFLQTDTAYIPRLRLDKEFTLDGIDIFHKKSFITQLSYQQSTLALLALEKNSPMYLHFTNGALKVERVKCRIYPISDFVFGFDVHLQLSLEELTGEKYFSKNAAEKAKEELQTALSENLDNLYTKFKKKNIDFFQIERKIQAYYPEIYNKITAEGTPFFQNASCRFNIEVSYKNIGEIY